MIESKNTVLNADTQRDCDSLANSNKSIIIISVITSATYYTLLHSHQVCLYTSILQAVHSISRKSTIENFLHHPQLSLTDVLQQSKQRFQHKDS